MNSLLLLGALTVGLIAPENLKEPTIKYTEDSVTVEGISLEAFEKDDTVLCKVVIDMPLGYEVYDDPETPYIEGIKINDHWLAEDLTFSLTECTVENPTVYVKTVYRDDLSGTLARIVDHNYDWSRLLQTPIGIALSTFFGLYGTALLGIIFKCTVGQIFKNRNSKRNAQALQESADKEATKREAQQEEFLETIRTTGHMFNGMCRNILKSMVLSNSKQKDANVQILDLLEHTMTDEELDAFIDDARTKLLATSKAEEIAKQNMASSLDAIANSEPEVEVTEEVKPEDTLAEEAEGRY